MTKRSSWIRFPERGLAERPRGGCCIAGALASPRQVLDGPERIAAPPLRCDRGDDGS